MSILSNSVVAVVIVVVLVICCCCLDVVSAQDCLPLPRQDSWSTLIQSIESAQNDVGFSSGMDVVTLCPFEITSASCNDHGQGYMVSKGLNLKCFDAGGGECIIDCPGRHFTVQAGSHLTIDGMTLRGSTSSSIHVMGGGVVNVQNSVLEDNRYEGGQGGAIYADYNALVWIIDSRLEGNEAENGGGIFSMGTTNLLRSAFVGNRATVGNGGAYFFSGSVMPSTSVQDCSFAENYAAQLGPAIYNGAHAYSGSDIAKKNQMCQNVNDGTAENCNGIYQFGLQRCDNALGLVTTCVVVGDQLTFPPTAAVTSAPTSQSTPTATTLEPSMAQTTALPTLDTNSPTSPTFVGDATLEPTVEFNVGDSLREGPTPEPLVSSQGPTTFTPPPSGFSSSDTSFIGEGATPIPSLEDPSTTLPPSATVTDPPTVNREALLGTATTGPPQTNNPTFDAASIAGGADDAIVPQQQTATTTTTTTNDFQLLSHLDFIDE